MKLGIPAPLPLAGRIRGAVGGALSRGFYATRRLSRSQHGRDVAFRSLMASQWWPEARLREEQWTRLTGMVRHAYEHVPYYRDALREIGAVPADIKTPADYAKIPFLTKQGILDAGVRLEAQGVEIRGRYRNHTGGSTGVPLSFTQDREYFDWGMAELDRNFSMCGYRPGWRQAFLWGSDYDSRAHVGFKGRLHDLILNLQWYNTFALSVEDVARIVAELHRFRPHLIVGYVSSLTMLVKIATELGLQLPTPRAIQTSAEVLTHDARRLVEDAFGAPCFDRYGCREVGNIAHECEAHAGLHLLVESNYVEFVPIAPGSETCEIVVTNLRNHAMPFLRYATGDTGRPLTGACSCGRGLPRMKELNGRVSDIIVAPSGRLIHGEFFTHLFYGADGIRQFQVEQLTIPKLKIRVAAASDDAYVAIRDRVTPLILTHGDPQFQIEWERVDTIPSAGSGKYRFTLSHVPLSDAKGQINAMVS